MGEREAFALRHGHVPSKFPGGKMFPLLPTLVLICYMVSIWSTVITFPIFRHHKKTTANQHTQSVENNSPERQVFPTRLVWPLAVWPWGMNGCVPFSAGRRWWWWWSGARAFATISQSLAVSLKNTMLPVQKWVLFIVIIVRGASQGLVFFVQILFVEQYFLFLN